MVTKTSVRASVAEDKSLPLNLKVPNAETRAAMRESDEMIKSGNIRFKTADEVFAALDKTRN